MTHDDLFALFLQSVLLSYSGWGSVAVVRDALVEQRGLLTDTQLTAYLALSQTTPGPLGFYLMYVGWAVSGVVGAALAWVALVLPSMLVIPIMRLLDRGGPGGMVRGASLGVTAAAGALMLSTAWELATHVIISPRLAAIALTSVIVLFTARFPSFLVVIGAAIIGAALG